MKDPGTPSRKVGYGRAVAWLCWIYLAVVLGVWALIANDGDAWWPATLLMFLPRWAWGAPLLLLALLALGLRPGVLWVALVGGIIVVWPLMGLCVPWERVLPGPEEPPATFRCRLLTCNVHRNPFALQEALAEARPDVIALQDWPVRFDRNLFGEGVWHIRTTGQFCVASRYPIKDFSALEPPAAPADTVVRASLETPAGVVRLYNLHLATPRQALVAVRQRGWNGGADLQANSDTRYHQSMVVDAWMAKGTGPALAAGDFNTPDDSTIYSEIWAKYTNAFATAGLGWGYTYHMNRTALRIDHILATPGWRCRDCWVGPDVGSEHRPVIADLEWTGRTE
jgi:endonuclease/exonuclease/phosphatase (EEP) superfamily protein YafD